MKDRSPTLMIDMPEAGADASSLDLEPRQPDPLKGGDVYQWAMDQSALIRDGRFAEVDWINVADEIESVGKSEFRFLKSHVEIIIVYMLKWDYQPLRCTRSWAFSIDEYRDRALSDLSDNPSLELRFDEAIKSAYRLARHVAAKETGLPRKTFPESSPYDWDAIMNRPFVPDPTDEPV